MPDGWGGADRRVDGDVRGDINELKVEFRVFEKEVRMGLKNQNQILDAKLENISQLLSSYMESTNSKSQLQDDEIRRNKDSIKELYDFDREHKELIKGLEDALDIVKNQGAANALKLLKWVGGIAGTGTAVWIGSLILSALTGG